MGGDTRERVIEAAMRLFAEKGYIATSIAEIARTADANPGSVYFFFPTKQGLLTAVLERYLCGIEPMLLAPAWAGVTDPVDRVFALLDRYRGFLTETGCTYGCPIGSLALELHEPDPAVRELLAANFEAWTSAVERCLGEAGSQLPDRMNLGELAEFVLTIMEGAVMQARTYRNLDAFDASIRMLREYFSRLRQEALALPEQGGRS